MAQSVLGGTIDFLGRLGVYDVLLPFLLVFTLVFAMLEKTKVLGIEVIKDKNGKEHTYTRKNLNAIVAFCIGFFVVASSQLVRVISEVMANVIIIVVAFVCLALTFGVFHTSEKEMAMPKQWKNVLQVVSGTAILFIVLNALGWLDLLYGFVNQTYQTAWFASLAMLAIFVGLMYWITKTPKPPSESSKSKDS